MGVRGWEFLQTLQLSNSLQRKRMKYLKTIICSILALWQILPTAAQIPLSDSRVVVRNEEKVNTEHLEYSPAFYREGIVFITNRHESLKSTAEDTRLGQNIMSLYESTRDENGFLQKSQLFSSELGPSWRLWWNGFISSCQNF